MIITNKVYNIRAEFPDKRFEDFQADARSMKDARIAAEEYLCSVAISQHKVNIPLFDWRGLVVFVFDREPQFPELNSAIIP